MKVEFPEARIYEETLNCLLYENRIGPDQELMQATSLRVPAGPSYTSDDEDDLRTTFRSAAEASGAAAAAAAAGGGASGRGAAGGGGGGGGGSSLASRLRPSSKHS